MRGRKPIPTSLKVLTGARIRGRSTRPQPVAEGIPTCPADILDPIAIAEWNRVTPLLVRACVVAAIDQTALAAYCASYSMWVAAERALAAAGSLTVTTRLGAEVPHPLLAISRGAADQMRRFAVELGMTPSARTRLAGSAPGPEEASPFAELARGKYQ